MRISDLMTGNVATIEPDSTCREALARMHRTRIRHLPVVDREHRLVGIVTDRDLRHRLFTPAVFKQIGSVAVATLLTGATVKEIMSTPVISVDREADVEQAGQLMAQRKVGALPVTGRVRVVGAATET